MGGEGCVLSAKIVSLDHISVRLPTQAAKPRLGINPADPLKVGLPFEGIPARVR